MIVEILKNRHEYFSNPALNTSTLTGMLENPKSIMVPRKISGKALDRGSYIDAALFDPKEEVDEQFVVLDIDEPTASLKVLADKLIETNIKEIEFDQEADYILNMINALGLWQNMKDDKKIAKIKIEFEEYVNVMIANSNKTIIPYSMKEQCDQMRMALLTSRLRHNFIIEDPNIEKIPQLAIVYQYKGVTLKGMLDIVLIDHSTKTIHPKDLKTTSYEAAMFPSSCVKYRYDIQAELYLRAMIAYRDRFFKDYSIAQFEFIVIGINRKSPMLYKMKPSRFRNNVNATRSDWNKLQSLDELISDFNWHVKNKIFDHTRKYVENGYCVEL